MGFPQVIATFQVMYDVIGLPGNLLVILTIILESRFHVMRYILLASLALSDFLLLILVNSFRIGSIAQQRDWLYGETMCYLNPFFARYFYINTLFHLVLLGIDHKTLLVRSPLTYDGVITKTRVVFMALIWIIPSPLSIDLLLGWGQSFYNPEVFHCEPGWAEQSSSSTRKMIVILIATAIMPVPFLVIVFLNVHVYRTAKRQINAIEAQVGGHGDAVSSQQQEMSRRFRADRKAAIDVAIIIAAFLVCLLPGWGMSICQKFVPSIDVPAGAVLVAKCVFFFSAICNPIIYSIRKREFRNAVKKMLRQIGVCQDSNDNDIV